MLGCHAQVQWYAHTAASEKAREAIGTYGAAVTALLMVVWPYLVLLASVSAVGNPAILSVQAPWGFIPVGLDYFTHPHIDKDDATHTIVFLTLWKAASGRQCKDFTSPRERGQHVSRNIFTFGGISAFTRSSDCDLLVFDARRVVHDVKAGRAVARGWLELAAQGRSAGRDAAKKLGMEFEQRIQENVSRGLGEVQSALEEQGGGSGRA
ncbi:hypothetical protein CHLRE_15g643400v5 [Chlamydomonas reinhardtii]|uniref:Uncharacterized protein n=1 Tax=Chlamydomonas reinhardtii TaxID=3055 RepID=A0A2K3CX19_CHLRE|nr:uncharacterized protein CHLRE_15g643400v5 [Chlamydomonas reinhardtii]PNW72809.1 hypothetical protein CHLRE_15g643400v5 [Chlamydomonas reinhardtii]